MGSCAGLRQALHTPIALCVLGALGSVVLSLTLVFGVRLLRVPHSTPSGRGDTTSVRGQTTAPRPANQQVAIRAPTGAGRAFTRAP